MDYRWMVHSTEHAKLIDLAVARTIALYAELGVAVGDIKMIHRKLRKEIEIQGYRTKIASPDTTNLSNRDKQ